MNQYSLTDPTTTTPILQTTLAILRPHLPKSLPLYRRLQFGRFFSTSHLLTNLDLVHHSPLGQEPPSCSPFIIAFVDRATRPETECWLYGSWEEASDTAGPDHLTTDPQLQTLVRDFARRVKDLRVPPSIHGQENVAAAVATVDDKGPSSPFEAHMADEGVMLFGAVGSRMLEVLVAVGVLGRQAAREDPNHVFLWEMEGLVPRELPSGLRWGEVREEDFALVRSRTAIPRRDRTLAVLPSLAIYDDVNGEDRPVAWGFVGLDASLTTLHVEERYRRRGLAKTLTIKLFKEKMERFHEEGVPKFAHGNVIYGNEASAALCRGLGGIDIDKCYWLRQKLIVA